MKKILFCITNLNSTGGTERVSSIIASKFASLGFDVTFLSLVQGDHPYFKLDEKVKVISLFPLKKRVSFTRHFLTVAWKLRRIVRNGEFETLVVVDTTLFRYVATACMGLNVKKIAWEHFNFNSRSSTKRRGLGRKLAAKYSDVVVTLTHTDADYWRKGLKEINSSIFPIPNPVEKKLVQSKPSKKNKTVLSVGRLEDQKGFDLLLKAWKLVCNVNNDWVLKIVGSGSQENILKKYVEDNQLNKRVVFEPATKTIDDHYSSASIYCLSSRYEGFPMVLLEAQQFGLPVVAFDCPTGPSEMISNGQNGLLIEPDNVFELSKGILHLIHMDDYDYSEMSISAKRMVAQYDIDSVMKKWLEII